MPEAGDPPTAGYKLHDKSLHYFEATDLPADGLMDSATLGLLLQEVKEVEELRKAVEFSDVDQRVLGDRLESQDEAGADDHDEIPLLGDIPLITEVFTAPYKKARQVAGRPVVAEYVALIIDAYSQDGDLETAGRFAEALAKARPDFEIGVKMRDVLADDASDNEQRTQKLVELGQRARKQLKATIAEARREARLRRVLAPALLELVKNPDQLAIARGVTFLDGGVLLTLLVEKVDAKTTKALTDAGLQIESAADSLPLIVGTAKVLDLERIALVESVRRIEPARLTPP